MWLVVMTFALPTFSFNNCDLSCQIYAWPACLTDTRYDFSFCRSEIDSCERTLIQERGCTNECCMYENCKTTFSNCARYMGFEKCERLQNGEFYQGSYHNIYHVCKHCPLN